MNNKTVFKCNRVFSYLNPFSSPKSQFIWSYLKADFNFIIACQEINPMSWDHRKYTNSFTSNLSCHDHSTKSRKWEVSSMETHQDLLSVESILFQFLSIWLNQMPVSSYWALWRASSQFCWSWTPGLIVHLSISN